MVADWLWMSPSTEMAPEFDPPSEHEETVASGWHGEVRLRVMEMSGEACAATVRQALLGCDGVRAVAVDMETKIVAVQGAGLDLKRLAAAVEAAGYAAVHLRT